MAEMGIGGQQTYPYLYPPLWAALAGAAWLCVLAALLWPAPRARSTPPALPASRA